ncbi:MMPL family transporter [Gordonia sp. McavH-238-E]|uniref:MMPL family transporter n=1 Tax=Gordonia sp. McavH-238-E TaxID=2917736 RepID=UPI0035ABA497
MRGARVNIFSLGSRAVAGGSAAFSGWKKVPILSFLPVIVVGILFGLAMDCQVFFLGSRIHEARSRGLDPRGAIIEGFFRSGPVVMGRAGDSHRRPSRPVSARRWRPRCR